MKHFALFAFILASFSSIAIQIQSEAIGINKKPDGTFERIEVMNIVHDESKEFTSYFVIYADNDDFSSIENIHVKEMKNLTESEVDQLMETDEFETAKNTTLALFQFRLEDKLGEMTSSILSPNGLFEINFKNAVAGTYTVTVTGLSEGILLEQKLYLKEGDNIKRFAIVPEKVNFRGDYYVKIVGKEMGYQNFLQLTDTSF